MTVAPSLPSSAAVSLATTLYLKLALRLPEADLSNGMAVEVLDREKRKLFHSA